MLKDCSRCGVEGSSGELSAAEAEAIAFEEFPPDYPTSRLPIVVFADTDQLVGEQRVWHEGMLRGGKVLKSCGDPDVRAVGPVVMSPAFLGFAIEPFEERYLHYRGVGMVFARPRGGQFMQPSIDTILVCGGLGMLFDEGLQVRRAIDVGSGSGFIGKFVARRAPGPLADRGVDSSLEVMLCDVDPKALKFAQRRGFNAQPTGVGERPVSYQFEAGDAAALLAKDAAYDLVVSNPPYVPTREEAREGGELLNARKGFWEGTGLLVHLVRLLLDGRLPPGAHLVLALTSLTLKSKGVCAVLEEAPSRGVRVRQLLEREVGYKSWYAGGGNQSHLDATSAEQTQRTRIGECEYFVGLCDEDSPRFPGPNKRFGYEWHVAYVLDLHRPAGNDAVDMD